MESLAFERDTPDTIIDRDALLREVVDVAQRGWALDDEAYEPFTICVGAPVYGPKGGVVAAISISVTNLDSVLGLISEPLAAAERVAANLYGLSPL